MEYVKSIIYRFASARNFSYLMINIGNIPVMALVSTFLAVYYVNILGMEEYAVGTMFLVARIFDAVNDPMIGYLIDRVARGHLNNLKKILVTGTFLCTANYLLLWIGPAVVHDSLKLAVAYISYILLGVTFPVMDISLNSMIPIMSQNREEREMLSSVKVIGYGIGTVFVEMFVPVLLSIWGASVYSYIVLIAGVSVGIIFLTCVGAVGIQESEEVESAEDRQKNMNSGYSVRDLLHILSVRNVWSTFLAGVCFYTGNAALAVSNTYFAIYYYGDIKVLTFITVATYSLELFMILCLPYFARKAGEKKLFGMGLLGAGIGIFLRVLPFEKGSLGLLIFFASSAVFGVGYGIAMILFYSIQAENVDIVYQVTGKQTEGAVASLMSMANKFGKGVGGAVPLYVLSVMKQVDGTYTDFSLRLIDGVIPAVLMVLGGIVFLVCYDNLHQKKG